MSQLSDLWSTYQKQNPGVATGPVPFQSPYKPVTTPAMPPAPVTSPSAAMPPAPVITTPTPSTPAIDPSMQKYVNPTTGQLYSPQEYTNAVVAKMKAGAVPNYAANQFANPNPTTDQLINQTTNLNNQRNDLAVGQNNLFGDTTGVAYTASELNAIQSAQAGVYDPAIHDAMAKLTAKQTQDKADAKAALKVTTTKATTFNTPDNISAVSQSMESITGKAIGDPSGDNYIDPHAWMAQRNLWAKHGGSDSTFVSNFKRYLNPQSYEMAGLGTTYSM